MQEFRRFPLTYGLIGLCTAAYLLSALVSGSFIEIDLRALVAVGALYGPLTVLHGEWWRLLSAMFLHGGMTHLLMNMVSLYIVGRGVEFYFTKTAYLVIYLFSGIIGGLVSSAMHPLSVGVGASGAIFGIFGALAGFFIVHRKVLAEHSRMFMKDFAVILGLNFLLGMSVTSIDMSAHIAGLVVGVIGGILLSRNPQHLWGYILLMGIVTMMMIYSLPAYYATIAL